MKWPKLIFYPVFVLFSPLLICNYLNRIWRPCQKYKVNSLWDINRNVIETEVFCSNVSICSTWLYLMVRVLSIPPCSILVNICPGEMWWNVCPPVMCTGVTLLHLKNFYQFKFFQPVDHLHGKCQKLHKSSQKLLSLTKFSEFPYLLV